MAAWAAITKAKEEGCEEGQAICRSCPLYLGPRMIRGIVAEGTADRVLYP